MFINDNRPFKCSKCGGTNIKDRYELDDGENTVHTKECLKCSHKKIIGIVAKPEPIDSEKEKMRTTFYEATKYQQF